jgi:translation initiation factor 4E
VIILLSLCDNLAVFVFSLVNFINPPSKLDNGSDYMLFKDGIQPMWEDVKNRAGGRWLLSVEKKRKEILDKYWEETVSCVQVDSIVIKLHSCYEVLYKTCVRMVFL